MVDSVILQKQRKWHTTGWFWALIALFIVVLMLLPVATIAYLAFFPKENIWPHLLETTLPRYLSNSLIVMSVTAIASIICGTAAAWLVVMKQFPGRRFLEWGLFLPLSIPTYIGAYALVDFWEYAGPFQTLLRDMFGWAHASDYWFPQVRTRGAAIFVFTLALYPYVYLMARSAFKEQSISAYETARTLGAGPWAAFFKIGLPLARPAIVVGASIVMMETLNDFGAVEFFAVQTLTTGIFTIWLEAQNAGGAAQIAIVMLLLVLGLMLIERSSRKKRRYYQLSKNQAPIAGEPLSRGGRLFAAGFCAALVGLGFVMPVAIMAEHALDNAELWLHPELWASLFNTVWTSGMAAIIAIVLATLVVYVMRVAGSGALRRLLPLTALGYAIPGAVIGLGIVVPLATVENSFADFIQDLTGHDIGLIFSGTAAAVVFAYCVRFFAIPSGAIDAGLGRIAPSLAMVARTLGNTPQETLRKVQIPLIRQSVLTAALLVFVDASKELPATLLLRPFGFDTLATHIYGYASLEDISGASPASLIVIAVSLCAVIAMARSSNRAN